VAENQDWTDKEILLASHDKAFAKSTQPIKRKIVPSDVLKIIKVMGYENFTTLVLPNCPFWDEEKQ
jgi:hypothetical protein